MGKRGELFTEKIFSEGGAKTYFLNVKENRFGDYFLNLVESTKNESGRFNRCSIIVFEEDMDLFVTEFKKACDISALGEGDYEHELKTGSGKRVYSFRIKTSSRGDRNLIVSESRSGYSGSFQGESIRIFAEDLEKYQNSFAKCVAFIEKR